MERERKGDQLEGKSRERRRTELEKIGRGGRIERKREGRREK